VHVKQSEISAAHSSANRWPTWLACRL